MNLLFICTGNTCRSPMAEALVRKNAPHINVQSAGIYAVNNEPANQNALKAMQAKQIKTDHLAQTVTKELLEWADLVLTMTTQHKSSLSLEYPTYVEKYFTLIEYVSISDDNEWDMLKKEYANFELKRSLFIQQNKDKLNEAQLEAKLQTHLSDEINKIQQLESKAMMLDISDPFGGSLQVYERTLKELNKYISLLLEKIK